MTDIRYYVLLAGESGVFKDIELEIMKETLEEWERRPDSPSTLIELSSGGRISGFAYFGPTHGTEFTFDLKWLVVDKLSRKQGVGGQLLERIEIEILKQKKNAILTVETTSRKEGAVFEGFYGAAGFSLVGHITDFYGKGDDYLMYAKHIHPPGMDEAEGGPSGEGPAAGGGQPRDGDAPVGQGDAARPENGGSGGEGDK